MMAEVRSAGGICRSTSPVMLSGVIVFSCCESCFCVYESLADRTNGLTYATVLRLSVCDVMYCG